MIPPPTTTTRARSGSSRSIRRPYPASCVTDRILDRPGTDDGGDLVECSRSGAASGAGPAVLGAVDAVAAVAGAVRVRAGGGSEVGRVGLLARMCEVGLG